VDESLGKVKGFGFLEQVRDEFKLELRSWWPTSPVFINI
jgi:hypothetical protein